MRLLKVLAFDQRRRSKHGRPKLSLRRVRHVVLDEADEMLLRGPETEPLRQLLRLCDGQWKAPSVLIDPSAPFASLHRLKASPHSAAPRYSRAHPVMRPRAR